MKIFVFMAWEYNAVEVGSRLSLEIIIKIEFGNNNKYFLLLPKSTRFLQGCLIFIFCKGTMFIGF